MSDAQHAKNRAAFNQQAAHFHEPGLTLTNQALLQWLIEAIAPDATAEALDVAAGTGIFSRALAARVRQVTALDLTDAMLAVARTETERIGLANIHFESGTAENLPYPANRFDLVATRLSFHHFSAPAVVLAEMVRVCRPGGQVAVCDLLSPDDPAVAERYNALERRRDPSHARALTLLELEQALTVAELRDIRTVTRDVPVVFDKWLAMTHTPPAEGRAIEAALRADLPAAPATPAAPAGSTTGMRPYLDQGVLHFLHRWCIVTGVKANLA